MSEVVPSGSSKITTGGPKHIKLALSGVRKRAGQRPTHVKMKSWHYFGLWAAFAAASVAAGVGWWVRPTSTQVKHPVQVADDAKKTALSGVKLFAKWTTEKYKRAGDWTEAQCIDWSEKHLGRPKPQPPTNFEVAKKYATDVWREAMRQPPLPPPPTCLEEFPSAMSAAFKEKLVKFGIGVAARSSDTGSPAQVPGQPSP